MLPRLYGVLPTQKRRHVLRQVRDRVSPPPRRERVNVDNARKPFPQRDTTTHWPRSKDTPLLVSRKTRPTKSPVKVPHVGHSRGEWDSDRLRTRLNR